MCRAQQFTARQRLTADRLDSHQLHFSTRALHEPQAKPGLAKAKDITQEPWMVPTPLPRPWKLSLHVGPPEGGVLPCTCDRGLLL